MEEITGTFISQKNQSEPKRSHRSDAGPRADALKDAVHTLFRQMLSPAHQVLDVACGDGGLAEYLLTLGARRYEGFDSRPEAIQAATERLARFSNARVQQRDALDPENYFRPFDIIVAHHFFHDLKGKDRETWLKICRSALFRSRGRLVMTAQVGTQPNGAAYATNREVQLELLNAGLEITEVQYPEEGSALYIARAL